MENKGDGMVMVEVLACSEQMAMCSLVALAIVFVVRNLWAASLSVQRGVGTSDDASADATL